MPPALTGTLHAAAPAGDLRALVRDARVRAAAAVMLLLVVAAVAVPPADGATQIRTLVAAAHAALDAWRGTFGPALVATVIAWVAGSAIGIGMAASARGWREIVRPALRGVAGIPLLLLVLGCIAVAGVHAGSLVAAIAASQCLRYARDALSIVERERAQPYVEAARGLALPASHVWRRHVLPNCASRLLLLPLAGPIALRGHGACNDRVPGSRARGRRIAGWRHRAIALAGARRGRCRVALRFAARARRARGKDSRVRSECVSEPLLELDGLVTEVRTPAGGIRILQDVSLSVAEGEVMAVVGEAGAGKSTLIDVVLGQVDPPAAITAGRVIFQGEDLRTLAPEMLEDLRGRRIAALLPDPASALHPLLPIEAQMLEGILAHHAIPPEAARLLARAAIMRVGMHAPEEWLHAYPHELGAGARQRAAMAIALVHEPALVVADEPAEALDPTAKGQMLLALQEFLRDTGAAMLLATRDLELATAFADRLAILHAGRVVEAGKAADVLAAPAHPYTRALINALPSRVPGRSRLRAQPGPPAAQARRAVGCTYRSVCERAIGSCVAVPALRTVGDTGQRRVVRCHNPLPLIRVVS